ncbi:hypothetical protein SacmaDRAFT_2710 [Saccharomonospora marina XMU15]|uniref:Lipoprotein n=1 Tax=Saccharomonospora marina XMU15 TaxID=882083 RepID=H5X2L2_9PSEU|nr:hypothetical protein [Saccharomonospora marina]EHR50951.1 hypothetical protein SacmaDRAFT_2710 [Saccharomonospora marina XMU15]
MSRFGTALPAVAATLGCVFGAFGVAACNGTPTTTTPSPAPTAESPTAESPTAGEDIAGLPRYRPSATISEAGGSTVLRTADSVEQVQRFYADVVSSGDWQVVSQADTANFASFVLKRAGQGASITIAPGSDSLTLITISTYPSS